MKRTALLMMLLVLLCGLCATAQAEEYTVPSGSFSTKVTYLKNVFPEGWYWNEWTSSQLGSATQKTITINGHTTTISTKPCTKHTSVQTSCNEYWGYYKGSQCCGWARMIFNLIWDVEPEADAYVLYYIPETDDASCLDYLTPGDIVWTGSHYMFVIAVNGDTLTVSDCNASYTCGIQWARNITKANIHSKMKSNGKGRIWSPVPIHMSSFNWQPYQVIYSGGLNMRSQPFTDTSKNIVGGISNGEIFRVNADHVITNSGGTWGYCQTSDGENGWVKISDSSLCVPYEAEECEHVNTEWVCSIQGTCTEYGLNILTCIDCGAELETETYLGHSHEWVTTKEPTCEEDGEEVASCVLCGEVIATEVIPAIGHAFDKWVTVKEPTCHIEGESLLTCSKCGDAAYSNLIPPTGSVGDWVTFPPTCTADGYDAQCCTICGAAIYTRNWISPLGHTYGTLDTTKEATCTEEGEFDLFCTVCGEYLESGTLPATGHDEGEWVVTKAPTCKEDGFKTRNCTRCGEVLETFTLGTIDHNWSEWVTLTEPTCIDQGEEARYCGNCGVIDTMPLWPLDHTAGEWVTIPPTCTEYGYDVQYCTVCGEQIASKNQTDFLGHIYGTLDTTKEATCTEEGAFDLYCTRCSEYLESGTLPAKGHTEGDWVVITEPTCLEAGEEGTFCTVCGEQLSSSALPSYGAHTGQWVTTKEPTCGENGVSTRVCTVCGVTETKALNATENHYFDDGGVIKEPTCTEQGEFYLICAVCGYYFADASPAQGHTAGDWVVITEATTTTDGLKRQSCTVCGETLAEETIPATSDTPLSNITMSAGANLSVVPGETVTVPISISNPNGVALGSITLYYTLPEGVTVSSVTTCGSAANASVTFNEAFIFASDIGAGFTGSGQVLSIVFAVDENVSFPLSFSLKPEVVAADLSADATPASINISIEEGDKRVPGDVNEDGKINSRDALAVLKHAAGQEVNINTANADVNADGKINSRDALAILKYAAGQDVTLK